MVLSAFLIIVKNREILFFANEFKRKIVVKCSKLNNQWTFSFPSQAFYFSSLMQTNVMNGKQDFRFGFWIMDRLTRRAEGDLETQLKMVELCALSRNKYR